MPLVQFTLACLFKKGLNLLTPNVHVLYVVCVAYMWYGSIVNRSIFLKSLFRRNSFRELLKVIVENKKRSN